MTATAEHTVASGRFNLDGGSWQVENNVWLVGDERRCVLIDAPHQAGPILATHLPPAAVVRTGMATRPASAPRRHTLTNGSPTATDPTLPADCVNADGRDLIPSWKPT